MPAADAEVRAARSLIGTLGLDASDAGACRRSLRKGACSETKLGDDPGPPWGSDEADGDQARYL